MYIYIYIFFTLPLRVIGRQCFVILKLPGHLLYYLGPVKRKFAFKPAQMHSFRFISRMRKVLSGHLFSIDAFRSIQWVCLRTVKAPIRLRTCAGWSGHSLSAYVRRYIFAGVVPFHYSIAIKHVFSCINIRQVPWEVLKTEAGGRDFQHLPRDLANVNALKNHVRSLLLHKNWKHLLHFASFLLHYFVSPFRYRVNAISMDYARSRTG